MSRLRFRVGDRVTVATGPFAGARGRITQRAHAQVRPHLKWVVTFDSPFGPSRAEWTGVSDSEIEPWTVPPEARPVSVGALVRGGR